MKRRDNVSAMETRALECVLAATVAFLAADRIRAALKPFWTVLKLLFAA